LLAAPVACVPGAASKRPYIENLYLKNYTQPSRKVQSGNELFVNSRPN